MSACVEEAVDAVELCDARVAERALEPAETHAAISVVEPVHACAVHARLAQRPFKARVADATRAVEESVGAVELVAAGCAQRSHETVVADADSGGGIEEPVDAGELSCLALFAKKSLQQTYK